MKINIITGFLGSGKTTILLSLASFLAKKYDDNQSVVIIENEIGEANVDGLLLAKTSYEVKSLAAGCICCSLTGDLISAFNEIKEDINPKHLLIEASGIAHQTIADTLSQAIVGLNLSTIVVIDAERWDEIMDIFPMLICTQLERADNILINKSDAVSKEKLLNIENEISEISNRPKFCISARNSDLAELWKVVITDD